MLRKYVFFLLLAGIPASGFSDVEMPVSGKRGAGLAEALRASCYPRRLAEPSELTFSMTDCFDERKVSIEGGVLPDGYVGSGLVCPDWWKEYDCYGDTVMYDLANFYPASLDVVRYRADFPPGIVETARYESGVWCSGVGRIGSTETGVYSPPESLRGRLARTYFYMAVIYPQSVMRPKAYTMFVGSKYPFLTGYARELLLQWHRENPPGGDEIENNKRMEALQGNVNPFVVHPEFAEYLWGDKAGEIYAESGNPVPLHSTYALSDVVYLTTPSAPEDTVWYVDGNRVANSYVSASSLGEGEHNIVYTSSTTGATGYVMIKIVR